jgi:gluconolactonase
MKLQFSKSMIFALAAAIGAQAQAPAPRQGPGVQSAQDAREPDLLKTCKVPPPAGRGGGPGRGRAPGGPPPAAAGPRDYTVKEIPGVIAAGQKWKEVWQVDGNNADGIIATKDGGLLIAQNNNSKIVKLDKDGKVSDAFTGLNTSGSVARSSKGALFVVNRGYKASVEQLEPKRKVFADKMPNGDPLDCLGGVLNDITADSKGGVYFTDGLVFHVDSKGVVTKLGENLNTNGIVLSADEKHLFVTNGASIAEFDVQKDGSLSNQHEFAKLEGGGGGDGSTFDTAGRLYVTAGAGVHVIGADGKYLGLIPTPRGIISVAFSGPDRKTLYVVARDNPSDKDWILGIPMIAQGPKVRGK